MAKNLARVSITIIPVGSIRVNGTRIKNMAMGPSSMPIMTSIRECGGMAKEMEMGSMSIRMEIFMMGSGSMVLNRVQECGEDKKEILTRDNGSMENLMDMEFIHGLMETHIKVNSRIVLSMDKAYKDLQMEISTKEVT